MKIIKEREWMLGTMTITMKPQSINFQSHNKHIEKNNNCEEDDQWAEEI